MFSNILRSNLITDISKCRIVKNLIVISLSNFCLSSGDDGLLTLQTTMNKEDGIGAISMAIMFIGCGFASLTCISFFAKKLGSKNAQILGMILMLPYIASNVYPTWITMLPAALLRGIGLPLFCTAQWTYFNESSVLFGEIKKNGRKSKSASNITTNLKKSDDNVKTTTINSDEQKVEQLSAFDLLSKTGSSNSNRLTGYRYKNSGKSEHKLFLNEKSTDTSEKVKDHNLKTFNNREFTEAPTNVLHDRKEDTFLENTYKESDDADKCQSYVDSTKSLFFGIHGLAVQSANVFSCLISYYVLKIGDREVYNDVAANLSCGAKFCNAKNESFNNSIAEVPDDTRYLLTGICIACAFIAPVTIWLFLDRNFETKEVVKVSWGHVFATIKYVNKTDQLLLIPFNIGVILCRGFFITDFTKSYIACSWTISHIGLISAVYSASSALSSIVSGFIIKYVGRMPVMALSHIIIIANFVFLFFWRPEPQQPYMFYVQATILGAITAILFTQTKAFYGILFEGDEETAFSSCNLYTSIGWALSLIYNDFFCTSVKIYIILAFSCTGFLGYLLAERSYHLRNKQKGLS